jgi:hypothetical protein
VTRPDDDDAVPAARRPSPRTLWLGGGALALVLVLVAVVVVVARGRDDAPAYSDRIGTATGTWLSGASGPGVVDGSFAEWRGRPVDIAATWADTVDTMTELYQLQPGGEFGDWQGPLDLAVGAIGWDESWAQAAEGAYDDRWRATLEEARTVWAGRTGTLYIRFAHESNGNWYPWAVDASEKDDFVAAWIRFRALQQEVFPESQLVFNLNRESVDSGFDWRESFPGAEYVDVLSVDYYNQYPYVDTPVEWERSLSLTDEWGAPKGLEGYRQFAEEQGLPLAVSEWSGMADQGDSPLFIQEMHDFFAEHGGTGPGDLLYEILFDIDAEEYDGNFTLFGGDTRMPESAAAYRESWSRPQPGS